jgi:hypothetical protein
LNEVVRYYDCTVLSGHRTLREQQALYEQGRSKKDGINNKSKHQSKPSKAVDVAPYPIDWEDKERFRCFGGFVMGVASQMGLKVRWGGDWDGDWMFTDQQFIDMPHFEVVEP